jgi:hypothetical protein
VGARVRQQAAPYVLKRIWNGFVSIWAAGIGSFCFGVLRGALGTTCVSLLQPSPHGLRRVIVKDHIYVRVCVIVCNMSRACLDLNIALVLLLLLLWTAGGLPGSGAMQLPSGAALGRRSGRKRAQKPQHVVSHDLCNACN